MSSFLNHSHVFDFERDFDMHWRRQWMEGHWHHTFYYLAAHAALIMALQAAVKRTGSLELRTPLIIWNSILAIFSICGLLRTGPEFIHSLRSYGFTHSVCNPSFMSESKAAGFWAWLFTLSKLGELGDTIFLVLRGRQVRFLHWYHHATVLIFAWYSYGEHFAPARWFVSMNFLVHSFMYTYYALRAAGFKVPRYISMTITTAQIMQMAVGLSIAIFSRIQRQRGEFCMMSEQASRWAILMYFSYLILFARFFYQAYCTSPRASKSAATLSNSMSQEIKNKAE